MTEVSAAVLAAAAFPAHTAPLAGGVALPPGSIVFANASGALAQDNATFFWDSGNHRLGVGTVAPANTIHAAWASDGNSGILTQHTGMSGSPTLFMGMNSGNNAAYFATSNNKSFKFNVGAPALTLAYGGAANAPWVGVNKIAPTHALDVVSNESANRDAMTIVHTIGDGGGNMTRVGAEITGNITSTDGSPQSAGWQGVRVVNNHGLLSTDTSGPLYATGSPGGIGSEVYVKNVATTNGQDESSAYFGVVSYWTEAASTAPGRGWFTDFAMQGAVGVQQSALSAFHMVLNNYYNGYPSTVANPSGVGWFITQPAAGAGRSAAQIAATTYPLAVGVGIIGYSGAGGSPTRGYDTALQVGGSGSNWGTPQSRNGVGIRVRDYDDTGVLISNPYTAAGGTQYALAVASGAGSVGIGTTAPTNLLHLKVAATNSVPLKMENTGGFNEMDITNGTITANVGVSSGTLAYFGTSSNHPAAFRYGATEKMRVDASQMLVTAHLTSAQPSGTVAAAAGANAGATPPAPVLTACTDTKGSVTFGTGTTPAAGAQVAVTFGLAYAAAPVVHVQAQNSATQALGPYISAVSTTGFTVSTASAPAASQANTVYSIGYAVIG